MNNEGPLNIEIQHYRELVRAIIQTFFGKPPSRLVYKPTGLTNHVFAVNHVEGQFVVRISSDPTRLNAFMKEQWTTLQAREAGVPTPEVLEVGHKVVSQPYMISRRVTGEEATHHPDRLNIVREMGRYARVIHSIRTKGFGSIFDARGEGRFEQPTWSAYLDREWRVDEKLTILRKYKMLSEKQLRNLRKVIDGTRSSLLKPSLNHGDLRLKNVIVDEAGEITAFLDWEECLSAPAPHWDLSIALHDLSIDEKQKFIDGYGLGYNEISDMAPLIKAFNIINYSQVVEAVADEAGRRGLEVYRARLQGALDLYCLG